MFSHSVEIILSLMFASTCFGKNNQNSRSSSWYIGTWCHEATNVTSDIELSGEGPTSGGLLALSSNSPHYKPGMNCTVELLAPKAYTILLSFSQVETRTSATDRITVVIEGKKKTLNDTRVECPKEDCAKYQFSGKRIQLNFSSAPGGTVAPDLVGFSSVVTAFTEANASTSCPRREQFRCQNLRCIWRGLYCNGQNNCGDGSDEPSHCPTDNVWGILVIVFGAVCFCIFVPLFCFLVLWGGRFSINTTTSKYQPLSGSSINSDSLPILTEEDFLLGSPLQYGSIRPHSSSFSWGSNTTAVQIHSPSRSKDNHVSKSLDTISSPASC